MNDSDLRIPRWLPPVLYAAVTVLLFRTFVFSSDMLFGTDTQGLGYMARAFYADAMRGEGFPLWNPYILGGTPFVEALAGGDSLYPLSAPLLFVMDPHRALGWKLVLHVFLAGIFMYGWVRTIGLSRVAATLSGLAFAMAPYMVSLVFNGQDGKIFVTALTPLAFLTLERALRDRRALDYAALALVIGLVILTTHFQLAYFLFGAMGAYAIFRTVQEMRAASEDGGGDSSAPGARPLAAFGAFLAAALLGAGIAGAQLLPAVEYVQESSRRTATTGPNASEAANIAYSSSFGLHPEEIVGMAIPEFAGSTMLEVDWGNRTYWGRNGGRDGLKTNSDYLGIVVLLLAGLSFFGAPRKGLRLFFAGLGVVCLLFALGQHTPVWRIFYELVPGISLFRAPSLTLFLIGFSVTTLFAFGVDRFFALDPEDGAAWKAPIGYALGIVGVFTLFLLSAASGGLFSFWTTTVYPEITAEAYGRLSTARPFIVRGAFIAVLMTVAFAGLVWLRRAGKLSVAATAAILGVLIAGDLFRINNPYILTQDFEVFDTPGVLLEQVIEEQSESDPVRIFSMADFGQDVRPGQHGLELAAGHHPNDLARYRELIGMEGSGIPQFLAGSPNVTDILNVGWLLWPDFRFGPVQDQLPAAMLERLEPVQQTQLQDGRVFETLFRVATLSRARLVGQATVVSDADAVPYLIGQIAGPDGTPFDPALEVTLTEPPPIALPSGPVDGTVTWVERSNNRHVLRVTSESNALLVVADNWYPAWRATVDGTETPVLRANHTLRAVPVSAGTHEVVFRYESEMLRNSLWLSFASLLVVTGIGAAALIRRPGRTAEASTAESDPAP